MAFGSLRFQDRGDNLNNDIFEDFKWVDEACNDMIIWGDTDYNDHHKHSELIVHLIPSILLRNIFIFY